ncbi:MAG TPA: PDZ domain-containing protein [Pirellulales bacterium]|nr:PDZ domain-containing protein [Pirellulales bacterium]
MYQLGSHIAHLMLVAQAIVLAALAGIASSAHGYPGQSGEAVQAFVGDDAPPANQRLGAALGVTLGASSMGGVAIAGVMPNSPAAEAGLRPDDVLFSIDGRPVSRSTDVINLVAGHEPGDELRLVVDRKGLRGTLRATLGTQTEVAKRAALGVTLSKSAHGGGVRVLRVVSGSPADKAGLKIGDRIMAIDDNPATTYNELIRLIGESRPGTDLKIDVDRYGLEGTLHASLTGVPQVFSAPRPVARPPVQAVQTPSQPLVELAPSDIDDQRGYGD